MLQDLSKLVNESKNKFQSEFENRDRKLSQQFKEHYSRFKNANGASVHFLDYSTEVTTSKNLKIIFPNQWFFMAAYMIDFASELINYKTVLDEIIATQNTGINKEKDLPLFKAKSLSPEFATAISQHFNGDRTQLEYMTNFITNYDWWNGSKTTNRTDFYVSPILSSLGVVAVSQGYIAEIAKEFALNSALKIEAFGLLNLIKDELIVEEPEDNRDMNTKTGGKNLIVYGAPGTGKSHYLDNYPGINEEKIMRVTFHPEYSYYDFVGSYKPTPVYRQKDGTFTEDRTGEPIIDYRFIPGPFTLILQKALENPSEMHLLLIEEINRANAAGVLGDLFQLLDRDENGKSVYHIHSDIHLLKYLNKDSLYIPSNLHIFATMNSSDQGVFVLDSAFKRRWNFMYHPIQFTPDTKNRLDEVRYGGKIITWENFVTAINRRLGQLGINEDRHIGPYFMKKGEPSIPENIAYKLLIYLWDDVVRYHRKDFFIPVPIFSELVNAYYEGIDIIPSLEFAAPVQEEDESADGE